MIKCLEDPLKNIENNTDMSHNYFTWNPPPLLAGLELHQSRVASGISGDEAEMIYDWALNPDKSYGDSVIEWDEDGIMNEIEPGLADNFLSGEEQLTDETEVVQEEVVQEEVVQEEVVSDIISSDGGWTFPISMSGGGDSRWEQFVKGFHEGNLHLTAGGNRYAKKLMEDISNERSVLIFLQITSGQKIGADKVPSGLAGIVEVDYEKLKENPIDSIREKFFYHEHFRVAQVAGVLSTREIVIPVKPIAGTRIHLQDAVCYSKCRSNGWSPMRKLCKNTITVENLLKFIDLLH